jgi:hypothetical protein
VQDITATVEDEAHKNSLSLELSRDSQNLNLFKLSVSVPRSVDSAFSTTILLQSQVLGPASQKLKVSFDPSVSSVTASQTADQAGARFDGDEKPSAKDSKPAAKPKPSEAPSSIPPDFVKAEKSEGSGMGKKYLSYVLIGLFTLYLWRQTAQSLGQ